MHPTILTDSSLTGQFPDKTFPAYASRGVDHTETTIIVIETSRSRKARKPGPKSPPRSTSSQTGSASDPKRCCGKPARLFIIGIKKQLEIAASACHQIETATGRKIEINSANTRGKKHTQPCFFPPYKRYLDGHEAAAVHVHQHPDFQASNAGVVGAIFRCLELPDHAINVEVKNRSVQPRPGALGRIRGALMGAGWSVSLRMAWKRRSRPTDNFASEPLLRLLTRRTNDSVPLREDASLMRRLHERWREDVQRLSSLRDGDLIEKWGFP